MKDNNKIRILLTGGAGFLGSHLCDYLLKKECDVLVSITFIREQKEMCRPDISMAEKMLNWSPKISLEEGLPKTIDYFKNLVCPSK